MNLISNLAPLPSYISRKIARKPKIHCASKLVQLSLIACNVFVVLICVNNHVQGVPFHAPRAVRASIDVDFNVNVDVPAITATATNLKLTTRSSQATAPTTITTDTEKINLDEGEKEREGLMAITNNADKATTNLVAQYRMLLARRAKLAQQLREARRALNEYTQEPRISTRETVQSVADNVWILWTQVTDTMDAIKLNEQKISSLLMLKRPRQSRDKTSRHATYQQPTIHVITGEFVASTSDHFENEPKSTDADNSSS